MTDVATVIELVGSSDKSWQDAARAPLNEAKKTIDGIAGIEVVDMTAKVDPNSGNIYRIPYSCQDSVRWSIN